MNCEELKKVSAYPKKKNHYAMTRDNPVYNQIQNPDMFKEKIIVTTVILKMRKVFFYWNNGHQDFYCSSQSLNASLSMLSTNSKKTWKNKNQSKWHLRKSYLKWNQAMLSECEPLTPESKHSY